MHPTMMLLEFRTELDQAPSRVFEALTRSELLARWFCDEAQSDPANGGRLVLRWTRPGASPQPFEARWVVFQSPVACAYEGGHSGYPDGYAGRVGFELAPRGTGTLLVTRHRLPAQAEYEPIAERYRAAWPRALSRLAARLAEPLDSVPPRA